MCASFLKGVVVLSTVLVLCGVVVEGAPSSLENQWAGGTSMGPLGQSEARVEEEKGEREVYLVDKDMLPDPEMVFVVNVTLTVDSLSSSSTGPLSVSETVKYIAYRQNSFNTWGKPLIHMNSRKVEMLRFDLSSLNLYPILMYPTISHKWMDSQYEFEIDPKYSFIDLVNFSLGGKPPRIEDFELVRVNATDTEEEDMFLQKRAPLPVTLKPGTQQKLSLQFQNAGLLDQNTFTGAKALLSNSIQLPFLITIHADVDWDAYNVGEEEEEIGGPQ
eukprot:Nk52_evm8s245 gene=Nk52_evmTU8s245